MYCGGISLIVVPVQIGPIQLLSLREVAAWAARLRSAVPIDVSSARPHIRAPDAATAAKALLFLVRWLFDDPGPAYHGSGKPFATALADYCSPQDVTVTLTSLGMLVTSSGPSPAYLDFEVYVPYCLNLYITVC